MTLLRDLIEIPERVHPDDFVLRLAEGVDRSEETVRHYVATPQLGAAFDQALDLIRGALASGSSKAAYLHGSFGSGKSHFMAVLHLLLQRHAAARAIEGLEAVVTRHDEWLDGKRFLLVPYHMIGKPNLEAAVLGGYAARAAALHPDAPPPGVYRAEGLFEDARRLREQLGDEPFFARLNETAAPSAAGGWGDLAARWDVASFMAALGAPAGAEARSRLVGALVDSFFRGYRDVARGGAEAFVPLDEGLAVIARHACDLGYHGLVLFLDELILWLATHAADSRFLNAEGPKVSKLVEAETADRPIPIVSFVARQRDLRELVGEQVTGAEQLGFADVLQWWEARFQTVTLDDRNLSEIAARRLLRPRSASARAAIDRAWAATERVRRDVFDTLLTPRADRAMFRRVYPFSPALVETLIAVSSLLQRERTALKVMLQLLVDRRDSLALGEMVPVGDLFDVIADGDEPFTEGMRHHFENARRLYRQKLLPLLESRNRISKADAAARPDDGAARAFRADDRLVKTLLLAALTPEVETLKNLTATRLAALNHGSIRTPIEGREGQEVLRRCRAWAAEVGEVRIGDDPVNPTVALQLSAVDTDGILANAERHDNAGNRQRKIREILFQELGVPDRDDLLQHYELLWRGCRRSFEVIFANVRELPDESLATRGDACKVIVDFPFDESGRNPADDRARLDDYRGGTAHTLVWLPAFLGAPALRDLGTLVKLDHLLVGERLRDYAHHLSPADRASAREILRSQQSQLRQRLVHHLEVAYGVDSPAAGAEPADDPPAAAERFRSLDPAFTPRPPARGNLKEAFEHLLDQMCASQYPAHPQFGSEVKPAVLRRVHEQVARAVREPEGRVAIDKAFRPQMTQIAVPLQLGEMGETHFVLGRHWSSHFDRLSKPLTVAKLRAAIDDPQRMALPDAAANLVILTYAEKANLSFRRHGGPWPAALDNLPDDLELRAEELPDEDAWAAAIERAGIVFGVTAASPLRNASNVSDLAERLGAMADRADASDRLPARLTELAERLGLDGKRAARLRTARATAALVQALVAGRGKERIERLAATAADTSFEAMGASFRKAADVLESLQQTKWTLFESLERLADDRADAAARLRRELAEAVAADEYVVALGERMPELENRAIALLAPQPPVEPTPPVGPPPGGASVVREKTYAHLDRDQLHELTETLETLFNDEPAARVELTWKLIRRADDR